MTIHSSRTRTRPMSRRRDFLRTSGLALGAIALEGTLRPLGASLARTGFAAPPAAIPTEDQIKALLESAVTAARGAGAAFADARISRQLQNFVQTREQQIINVVDTDSIGCGVRALVDGVWGFAATRTLTTDAVAGAARE